MAFIREFLKSGVLSTMRKTFSHYLQIHFDGARLSGGVLLLDLEIRQREA